MARITDNISQVWQRTSLVQRVLLLGIVLACVGAGALLVNWARQPKMALLYANLAPEDASKIADKIRDAGVPMELRDGGTTILVPDDKKYSLRLQMASASLPSPGGTGGHEGYSIFDRDQIGASPFTQQVNAKRAIEGELAKTIERLDGVGAAKVLVAKPTGGSVFSTKELESSASVTLTLRGGRKLTPGNVAAITYLVASSVPGLTRDRVVVVSSDGVLLSGEASDGDAGRANSLLDYKAKAERYLAGKVEEVLAQALGPGRATVKVEAIVDMDSEFRTTEATSAPAAPVPLKEETTKDKSNTEYAPPGHSTATRTIAPGKITLVSVAALVDLAGPKPAEGQPAAATLPADKVKEIIRNTLGLVDDTKVTVVDTPFAKPAPIAADMADAGGGNKDFYLDIAKNASLGVLVVGALLALKMTGGSRKKKGATAMGVAGEGAAALAASGGNLLPAESMDPSALRARITQALQDNPEEVKRLFLNWTESERMEV